MSASWEFLVFRFAEKEFVEKKYMVLILTRWSCSGFFIEHCEHPMMVILKRLQTISHREFAFIGIGDRISLGSKRQSHLLPPVGRYRSIYNKVLQFFLEM